MRLPLDARIYVAGHDSSLGHMLCNKLQVAGYRQVITRSSHELNLRNQLDVNLFFEQELPDYVFLINDHTAGQVDEVIHPAEFLYGRLLGLSNVIHASYVYEVRKLLNVILTAELGTAGAESQSGAALDSDSEDRPSTEALIQMVTLGLCDRYRQQYSCDFITARLHLADPEVPVDRALGSWAAQSLSVAPQVEAGSGLSSGLSTSSSLRTGGEASDQLYSLDPTDACLFLMEHFSSTGAISVRSGSRSFVVP